MTSVKKAVSFLVDQFIKVGGEHMAARAGGSFSAGGRAVRVGYTLVLSKLIRLQMSLGSIGEGRDMSVKELLMAVLEMVGPETEKQLRPPASGETRCLECYTNVTVLRHPVQGSVGRVIANSTKPVLNAGDGVGEHTTQALDVFTIYDELKLAQQKNPRVVVLLGDLKHGRTVHSLAKLLVNYLGVVWEQQLTLRYCAPAGLEMPDYVQEYCSKFVNVQQETYTDMKEACRDASVLYATRVQWELFDTDEAYENVKGSYVVDQEFMRTTPKDMIVLHPLPRVDEISMNVDRDPRAAYFRQMENGMFVRMALLALVLGKSEAAGK